MKVGKSPGIDGIPAAVYKCGGEAMLNASGSARQSQDLRYAVTVSPYTNKAEKKSDCSNYLGITILSIAGKILARVLGLAD